MASCRSDICQEREGLARCRQGQEGPGWREGQAHAIVLGRQPPVIIPFCRSVFPMPRL